MMALVPCTSIKAAKGCRMSTSKDNECVKRGTIKQLESEWPVDLQGADDGDRKWAVVTGATSGIGKATAIQLAKNGFSVLAIGRRSHSWSDYENIVGLICDVRNLEQVKRIPQFFEDKKSYPSLLINSAGLAKGVEDFPEAKIEDWDQMIDTNVRGLLYVCRALIPLLEKAKLAHIVNIGSVAGKWVYRGGSVYAGTKFAVRAISEGLRMDLIGKKIRVTNVEPGMVDTEFSLVRLGNKAAADKVYEGMNPLTPEDIADTIIWSISRPAHVNIQELVIFPTAQAAVGQVWRSK